MSDLVAYFEAIGFAPKKRFGQNFLVDNNIVRKIVEAVDPGPENLILEIGPGMGELTRVLAESGARVTAIEIDHYLASILNKSLTAFPNVSIHNCDVMKAELTQLLAVEKKYGIIKAVGNLPYYITTPVVFRLLDTPLDWERVVLMVQKEVADRITAGPGGKDYGALSVAIQYRSIPRVVASVSKNVFYPRPEVDSAVICLDCRKRVQVESDRVFSAVVRAAFGRRRKTLRNSLQGLSLPAEREIIPDKQVLLRMFSDLNLDGGRRAETLSVGEFAEVANWLTVWMKG